MSETWYPAVALADLPPGEVAGCEIAGRKVAVYRTQDGIHATADVCSHAYALLSEGLLEGCEIECPLHAARFDIRTGEAISSPAYLPIEVYATRVAGDIVEVALPPGE